MIAATYNISLYQGDSYSVGFILRDVLRDGSGVPILSTGGAYLAGDALDLDGSTVKAQIRVSEDDSAVAAEFAVDVSTTVTGKVTLSLTSAQTSALTVGKWDVQVTFPNGDVLTVLKGAVKVTKEVTRA